MHQSAAVLALSAFALTAAGPGSPRFIDVKLVTQTSSPAPGKTVLVGLEMTPQPGWHGYWSNPGENGLAPVVRWTAPSGVRFGPLEHPAPTLLQVAGVTSFVHEGPHTLIVRMSVGPNVRPGTPLPIAADVNFAACSDKLCVPEHVTVKLDLVAGSGVSSIDTERLRRAAAAIPRRAADGTFAVIHGKLLLKVPGALHLDGTRARFFPDTNGYFDPVGAHVLTDDPLRISSPVHGPLPMQVAGVVSDGSSSYRVDFRRGPVLTPAEHQAATNDEKDKETRVPTETNTVGGAAAPAQPAIPESRREVAPKLGWLPLAGGLLALLMMIAGWRLKKSRR